MKKWLTNQKMFFFVYTARQAWGSLILTTSLVLLLFTFINFSISIQELCTHEQEVHNSPILAHITSKCFSQGITGHHWTLCSNHKMFIVQSKDYQIELIASSFPHSSKPTTIYTLCSGPPIARTQAFPVDERASYPPPAGICSADHLWSTIINITQAILPG